MSIVLSGSGEHVLFMQPLSYGQLVVQATDGHALPATDV